MAKISAYRRKRLLEDSLGLWYCLGCILWILHVAAILALAAFVCQNYCHLDGKGRCRQEKDDSGDYEYVRSNLTSAEKEKCEKYKSGSCISVYTNYINTYIEVGTYVQHAIALHLHG